MVDNRTRKSTALILNVPKESCCYGNNHSAEKKSWFRQESELREKKSLFGRAGEGGLSEPPTPVKMLKQVNVCC